MKKSVAIVDWLLMFVFLVIIISKFVDNPFIAVVQLSFFALIIIHVIQHRKVIVLSVKKLKR